MDRQERLALKKQYNDAGIAVMVGAFGATDNPTISHPYVAGTKLGYYVLGNDFDGVDVDFQGEYRLHSDQVAYQQTRTPLKIARVSTGSSVSIPKYLSKDLC
jgi:hypothetical protein